MPKKVKIDVMIPANFLIPNENIYSWEGVLSHCYQSCTILAEATIQNLILTEYNR